VWEDGKEGKGRKEESTKNCRRTTGNRSIAIEAKRDSSPTLASALIGEVSARMSTLLYLRRSCDLKDGIRKRKIMDNDSHFTLHIRGIPEILKFAEMYTEVHRTSYLRFTSLNNPFTRNERVRKRHTSSTLSFSPPTPTLLLIESWTREGILQRKQSAGTKYNQLVQSQ
jgi:hypothetical protein